MSNQIILVVEDNADDAFLIKRKLGEHVEESFELMHVTTIDDAQKFIVGHKNDISLILLDLGLPDSKGGRHTFQSMRIHSLEIPIVILTGMEDHDLAVSLVREGAQNFVNKNLLHDKPELLRDVVDFAISRHQLMSEVSEKAREEIAKKDQVISWMSGDYSLHR